MTCGWEANGGALIAREELVPAGMTAVGGGIKGKSVFGQQ